MADDWFRSKTWTKNDREHFETRLARARATSRAQYIRIQAVELADSASADARAAAGELFGRLIRDFGEDDLQVAMGHTDKARWHQARGELREAVDHYRQGVAHEDGLSGGALRWGGDLSLAELLIELDGDLDEAQEMLERASKSGLAFRSQRWRWFVADARVANRRGDPQRSASSARAGLDLLTEDQPDFPRHPDLGHIDAAAETIREVRQLAAATPRRR